jgi:hypothetical protein
MKKSLDAPTRAGSGRQCSSTSRSTKVFGSMPASSADWTFFDAFSSVPVRKNVSSPRCR